MSKFHISPKTNRAGICRAKEGGCPFGENTPHFKTKEEAKAFIAGKAAAENSMFTTTRKSREPRNLNHAETISAVIDPYLAKDYLRHRLCNDMQHFWGITAVEDRPGCGGCLPPYDDYCRCARLTGKIEFEPREIAGAILHSIADNKFKTEWNKRLGQHMQPTPEDKEALAAATLALAEVIKDSELVNSRNWDLSMRPGYYGDEVERLYFIGDRDKLNKLFESYFFNN